jgi:hypothetical protein
LEVGFTLITSSPSPSSISRTPLALNRWMTDGGLACCHRRLKMRAIRLDTSHVSIATSPPGCNAPTTVAIAPRGSAMCSNTWKKVTMSGGRATASTIVVET